MKPSEPHPLAGSDRTALASWAVDGAIVWSPWLDGQPYIESGWATPEEAYYLSDAQFAGAAGLSTDGAVLMTLRECNRADGAVLVALRECERNLGSLARDVEALCDAVDARRLSAGSTSRRVRTHLADLRYAYGEALD